MFHISSGFLLFLKQIPETWFYVFDSATKSKAQVGQAICCAELRHSDQNPFSPDRLTGIVVRATRKECTSAASLLQWASRSVLAVACDRYLNHASALLCSSVSDRHRSDHLLHGYTNDTSRHQIELHARCDSDPACRSHISNRNISILRLARRRDQGNVRRHWLDIQSAQIK